jgi:hypothetical protein
MAAISGLPHAYCADLHVNVRKHTVHASRGLLGLSIEGTAKCLQASAAVEDVFTGCGAATLGPPSGAGVLGSPPRKPTL